MPDIRKKENLERQLYSKNGLVSPKTPILDNHPPKKNPQKAEGKLFMKKYSLSTTLTLMLIIFHTLLLVIVAFLTGHHDLGWWTVHNTHSKGSQCCHLMRILLHIFFELIKPDLAKTFLRPFPLKLMSKVLLVSTLVDYISSQRRVKS